MTTPSRIYSDMIHDLVRDLTCRSDVRRASAVERCEGLPEDLLLDITSKLLVQYNKQIAWRWAVFLVGAIGAVSFLFAIEGNLTFAYGLIGLGIAWHLQLTYRHTGRSLHGILQNSEDKRLIPVLLMKYSTPDGSGIWPQQTRVRDLGLTQLLPYVEQSDDEMWTHAMRARLAALLRNRNSTTTMTHGVLHALTQIGDDAAIPDLLPLTRVELDGSRRVRRHQDRGRTADLREAAIRCVEAIRVRVNDRLQQTVLLRPCATDVPLRLSLPRAIEVEDYRAGIELMRPTGPNPDYS